MQSFERAQVGVLRSRLAETPHRIISIFGPRQTGKTTIVRQALRRHPGPSRYLAVDDLAAPESAGFHGSTPLSGAGPEARNAEWLIGHWQAARRRAQTDLGGYPVLVFDEIQKIPAWSEVVKGLWDADRFSETPLHIVILGSAPLLMQSGLRESLAGRFEPIHVSHWSYEEMARAFGFSLDQYLYYGGYPGLARYTDEEPRWRNQAQHVIIEPSVEADVLAMTRVDKPALLRRLFGMGAEQSGQVISYNKLLGQLHDAGNTTTLARYLDLLGQTGLLTGLQKHAGQAHRRRGSSPKLCVLNPALMTAVSSYTFDSARADRTQWGRVVESAVGAHLVNTAGSITRVEYWRENGYEVDFVLRRGARLVAIEVKARSRAKHGDQRGLTAFMKRFRTHRALIVSGPGSELPEPVQGAEAGVEVIALDQFLMQPADAWFEPT